MRHMSWMALLVAVTLADPGPPALSQQSKDTSSPVESKAIIIIGRLKDFGTRNWRPSVYLDEVQLARSQNGRYLVARVDPGKHVVRAEDPKYSLQMDLKPGTCYFFRVEIATGFSKAYGRLVGITPEQGAADLKRLTLIDSSHLKDNTMVLSAEQAPTEAAGCAARAASPGVP